MGYNKKGENMAQIKSQADYNKCGNIGKQYLIYKLTIKGCSKNTVNSYCQDLLLFFKFLKVQFGLVKPESDFETIDVKDVDINLLKKVKINDIYEFLYFVNSQRNNNSTTRARKVSVIRGFFKYLTHNQKLLEINPAEVLDAPKIKKALPKYLNLEESKMLLKNVDGKFSARDYCIITIFLNCGLRLSELVSLNVADVSKNPITVTGKGNKERQVYLNNACLDAITDYLQQRTAKPTEEALFLNQNGTRISKRRVQEIVENNLKKNGLFNYSTHKLRHTAATLMFQYGDVDVRTLQEILGHASLSTTQIYTHVSSKQLKQATTANPLAEIKKTTSKTNKNK